MAFLAESMEKLQWLDSFLENGLFTLNSDLVYCSCTLDHELLPSNKCEILLSLTYRNCQDYPGWQGRSACGYFAKGMDKVGLGYF